MKRKIIATLLAATMAFSLAACGGGGGDSTTSSGTSNSTSTSSAASASSGSEDAADSSSASGETASDVESPVAGKKIAYIMLMSPATIFQMWSDSFEETANKLVWKQIPSSARTMRRHGRVPLSSAHRADTTD